MFTLQLCIVYTHIWSADAHEHLELVLQLTPVLQSSNTLYSVSNYGGITDHSQNYFMNTPVSTTVIRFSNLSDPICQQYPPTPLNRVQCSQGHTSSYFQMCTVGIEIIVMLPVWSTAALPAFLEARGTKWPTLLRGKGISLITVHGWTVNRREAVHSAHVL